MTTFTNNDNKTKQNRLSFCSHAIYFLPFLSSILPASFFPIVLLKSCHHSIFFHVLCGWPVQHSNFLFSYFSYFSISQFPMAYVVRGHNNSLAFLTLVSFNSIAVLSIHINNGFDFVISENVHFSHIKFQISFPNHNNN